jgi:hypothetical protein
MGQIMGDTIDTEDFPKHRWLNFFWGASSVGVASGLYAAASAALPLLDVAADSRIPLVTGAGAPFVAGAGLMMVFTSLASLWWAKSRIQRPLDRFNGAAEEAVHDGFNQPLSLGSAGIGPQLSHAADQLHSTILSITDAGLDDGSKRLRLAFRGSAADRFENIMTSLKGVHDTILSREVERDAVYKQAVMRTDLATQCLERTSSIQDEEQKRLQEAVAASQTGLEAIRTQLATLAEIKPEQINGVVDALRDQGAIIDRLITQTETTTSEVQSTTAAFGGISASMSAAFDRLHTDLMHSADGARAMTTEREAQMVQAFEQLQATMRTLVEDVDAAKADVITSSTALRTAGQTITTTATSQSEAIKASLMSIANGAGQMINTLSSDLNNTVVQADAVLKLAMSGTLARVDNFSSIAENVELRLLSKVDATEAAITATTATVQERLSQLSVQAAADVQDVVHEASARVERLSDHVDNAELRLIAAVESTESTLTAQTASVQSRLTSLSTEAIDRLEEIILRTDTRLLEVVAGTGDAAANALLNEMAPVRDAARDHGLWLRGAMMQMRHETERLSEAQQAAMAVRALSAAAEEQLRTISDKLSHNAEGVTLATERAMHDIETRSQDTNARLDRVSNQAERATAALTNTIEPLVGLLGKTRATIENMANIEESQLAPALRRIQSGLVGLTQQLEERDEDYVRKTSAALRDQVRRSVDELAAPIEALGTSFGQQRKQIEAIEIGLSTISSRGEKLPQELAKTIGTWCADQLHAASDRMISLENGIEQRIESFGKALNRVADATPKHIDTAIGALHDDIAKQLAGLSAAQQNMPVIDMDAIAATTKEAALQNVTVLTESLKSQLADLAAQTRAVPEQEQLDLGGQIEKVCALIEAVEREATAIAYAAIEDPASLAQKPDAAIALQAAERALGGWSKQIGNVSTAVAIAMDAAHFTNADQKAERVSA